MGNSSTKEKPDAIDGGILLPHGIYTTPQDYDFRIVQRLILQRRLAPFYKGLEECDDSEDALELKRASTASNSNHNNHTATTTTTSSTTNNSSQSKQRQSSTHDYHSTPSSRSARRSHPDKSPASSFSEESLYRGAIECPICFLYYPRNINRTRCCDKPMCTECFVQLKRLESAPTESPACPYCVEPHFGVIYSSALLPAGFASSNASSTTGGTSMSVSSSSNSLERGCSQSPHSGDSSNPSSPSGRRRSTSHKSPEVVSADDLRPDWNRRILAAAQRQPGSRRASMSSSVSGATFALGRRLAASRQGSSSRRSNSSTAAADYSGYLTAMRHMGTDLEELMIMEAVRQSLQDEQDRLAREATGAQSAQSPPAGSQPLATSSSLTTVGQGTTAAATTAMTGVLTNPLSVTDSSQESTSRGGDSQTSDSEVDEESSDSSDEEAPGLLENQAIRYAAAAVHGTGPLACLVPSTAQIPLDGTAPKHRAEGQRATEL